MPPAEPVRGRAVACTQVSKEKLMARMQRDDRQGARTVIGEANPPATDAQQRHRRISEAAYHRWQKRGGDHGADQKDWYEAESEVDGEGGPPRQ
jgi:hypothetical protein